MTSLYEKIFLGIIIPAASVVSVFITPEINLLQQHFSVNASSVGKIMSYYLVGYLIGQPLFAFLSRKTGYKTSIQLGFTLSLFAMIIQIKAFDHVVFSLFLLGRFLTALGLSTGLVSGFAYLKKRFSGKEEKYLLSIITVVFTFSIYFSITLSGNVIKYFNIDFILWVNFYYILVLIFSSFLLKKDVINAESTGHDQKKNLDMKITYIIITYSFCLSVSTIFAYCYAIYAPIYLMQTHHLTPTQYSNYNFINLFAILMGSYIYTRLSNKVTEYKLILISMILLFSGSLFLLLSEWYPVIFFLSFSFILNALCATIYPAATYKCLQIGTCKATSSAVMNTFKIGMPTIAIFLFGNYNLSPLTNLVVTISFFSFLFIFLLFFLWLIERHPINLGSIDIS